MTVLEPGEGAGSELSNVRRWRVLEAVQAHGQLQLKAAVTEITAKQVLRTDKAGAEPRTPADSAVLPLALRRTEVSPPCRAHGLTEAVIHRPTMQVSAGNNAKAQSCGEHPNGRR